MAKSGKTATRFGRPRAPDAPDLGEAMLTASIDALGWRLREAATRIGEASAAIDRGDGRRALDRLLELEPLVFDAGRVLSAVFLLAREAGGARPDRTSSADS